MKSFREVTGLSLVAGLIFTVPTLFGSNASVIHIAVDESKLVQLTGNTRPEASAENDKGAVADDFQMSHLLLQLKRAPEVDAALEQYIDDLHNPSSPNFHKWLTADQFAASFGVASDDVKAVTDWLTAQGFTVDGVVPSGLTIEFSGTAGLVRKALHTEVHHLSVKGANHFANMSDPQIPAALAPAVAGVLALHDFHPTSHAIRKPQYTITNNFGTFHALVPYDIATIYNIKPLWDAHITGKGQTIMVVEDTYLYDPGDWTVFRKTFGLARTFKYGTLSQVSPKGSLTCKDPGFQGSPNQPGYGDDGEAVLDVEWATAAAPDAAIVLAACTDTKTVFGGLIALENTLNGPVSKLPSVVSISYGESEAANGAAANLAYASTYQQAVAEGVSIFVSAGDEDAASSDGGSVATHGITVSGFTSTPYNVSVGGTDFGYVPLGVSPSVYWADTNINVYSSALSYIQEIPWNDSCAGSLTAGFLNVDPLFLCNYPGVTDSSGPLNFLFNSIGGSGGPSGCATGVPAVKGRVSGTCVGYAKPKWQSVLGNPSDGVRDTPDVSLFASNGFWDSIYVVCWSNPDPNVGGGGSCNGAPSTWAGFGGTSVSSPIMAAIQALVDQKTGSRWGNPNTVYYSLAKAEYGTTGSSVCDSANGGSVDPSCIFYDITQGDNDGACGPTAKGAYVECYHDSNIFGILSKRKKTDKPAYPTKIGWDFSTGIGSVNAYNLVMNWPDSDHKPKP